MLWVRSYRVGDWLRWTAVESDGREVRTLTVNSGRGGLLVEDYRLGSARGDWTNWPVGFASGTADSRTLPAWTPAYLEEHVLLHRYPADWSGLAPHRRWGAPAPEFYSDRAADASFDNR